MVRRSLISRQGKSAIWLSSPVAKNIGLYFFPKSPTCAQPSRPHRGALAIVTNVGMGCGGRGSVGRANGARRTALQRTAKPCGPDAPMLAFKLVRSKLLAGDGG